MQPRYLVVTLVLLLLAAPFVMTIPSAKELEDESGLGSGRSTSNALLWGIQAGGSSSTDAIMGIAMDAQGRTYACGYFYNTATFGSITLNGYGSTDIFVGRISNGNWDWVEKAGSTSSDQCQDIAVDDGGNISITGYFYNTATFGNTQLSSQGSYDIFVARLDADGNWLWATRAGSGSQDYGYGVAVDEQGNSYITGTYYSTSYFGAYTLQSYSYDEAFIAALNPSGQFTWAERMYGSYYQRGRDIDVNQNGDVVVTGEFSYRINIGGSELVPSYSSSNYYRIFVAMFDTSGNYQWARMAGYLQSSYSSYGEAVAVADNGDVAVAARFQYLVDFHTNGNNRIFAYQNGNNWDCLVAKWDSNGNYLWAQVAGGSSTDYCYDLEMDNATGDLVVSGMYQSNAWFANSQLSSSGSTDAFIAYAPSAGGWDWAKKFGGSSSEYGWAVGMRSGMYAFGGYFHSSASAGSGSTSITLSSIGGADIFLIMFGSDQDGDGIGDSMDDFPLDRTQWRDTDKDGYGDNPDGWQPDSCIDEPGTSTIDRFGCLDSDGDGWSDENDLLPFDPSQWVDSDGDGFGENATGTTPDACPMVWGTSWRDVYGCHDLDSDGQSDLYDDFFNDPTQWFDSDSDGLGDNWGDPAWNATRMSHWPGEWFPNATNPDPSPLDWDGDGFEDANAGGPFGPFDDCVYMAGTSIRDLVGCPDADGDGWSDEFDEVDDDPTQWADFDGDGFGDNPNGSTPDGCPTRPGTSWLDAFGCPDNDGDGLSNEADECPTIVGLAENGCPDTDGDGYVDEGESPELQIDDCPLQWGTSHVDRYGCHDSDGDGVSDLNDPFPFDGTQSVDEDEDGFGDNADGNNPDDCLNWAGTSSEGDRLGCPDNDGDGWADSIDPWPNNGILWSDSDGDGYSDQQTFGNQSDDCPMVYGTSNRGFFGCSDLDEDGWPDMLDLDIDGDGYGNEAELTAEPPTDPFDARDTPADADGNFVPDHLETAKESTIDDPVIQGVLATVLTLLVAIAIVSYSMFSGSGGQRRVFDQMQTMVDAAEGFDGLADVEEELDSLIQKNKIGAGQGMLLKDRLEARRFAFEDDSQGAAMSEWWAAQQQTGGEQAAAGQTTQVDTATDWSQDQHDQWLEQARQWGGYYDHDGTWVPFND